jgi:drug/metabolite transporter (DMT)-like permease
VTYLLLAALIWGSSFPVISYALGDISPMLFVFLRFAIAFVVVTPFVEAEYRRRIERESDGVSATQNRGAEGRGKERGSTATAAAPSRWRHIFDRRLILIAIPNGLSFILQFKGQELTTASKMALFVNSAPIWVVPLSIWVLNERIQMRQILAMVVALAGVVITSTHLNFTDLAGVNIGDVIGIGVGMLWAIFIAFSGPTVRRLGPWELSQGLYFWTAVLALPLVFLEPAVLSSRALLPLLYLALVTTVLAYLLYLKGARIVSSVSTSIIILIEVVVAFAISAFFLGDRFSLVEAVGVAMVMGGVLLVLKPASARPLDGPGPQDGGSGVPRSRDVGRGDAPVETSHG